MISYTHFLCTLYLLVPAPSKSVTPWYQECITLIKVKIRGKINPSDPYSKYCYLCFVMYGNLITTKIKLPVARSTVSCMIRSGFRSFRIHYNLIPTFLTRQYSVPGT